MKRAIELFVLTLFACVVGMVASTAGGGTGTGTVDVGTRHAPGAVETGTLRVAPMKAGPTRLRASAAASAVDAQIGDERIWFYVDEAAGFIVPDFFTLRAIGQHTEVWVQDDTNFPEGDCRNDDVRNVVTDAQVASLVKAFDTNIYPRESSVFSVPRARDGSSSPLYGPDGLPDGYYAGDGGKIVTLVENVRDANYYDTDNEHRLTYIAGFFSQQLSQLFDRNVMTVDVFDWLHRTGADPPDDPSPDPCTSAPARPFLYEGTFAHEYQHLLENDEDADEVTWVNEGLSDWAQTLTGYVNPALPITDSGFDSHIQCFLGWLAHETPANPIPRPECGPENSLTLWGDQGDPSLLADYGAAYSFMELLQNRFGNGFMTALHRNDAPGLAGLQAVLDDRGGKKGKKGHGKVLAQDVLHDWSLAVALDGLVDGDRYHLRPGSVKKKDVTVKTLAATVDWDNPRAYESPGAPPNGADYVRLRDASGNYLSGDAIDSISFTGATTVPPPLPVAWAVDQNPPTASANPALYSGADDERDEAIVRRVTVPKGKAAQLTFRALWNEEDGWDFGFVQVSDDGGSTYTSLACTDTTTDHDPDAVPTAAENVPGFTGYSGTFRSQTCSLAGYAGKTILLAFRAFDDPQSLGATDAIPAGFWVDDVKLGGTTISDGSSLAGWESLTQARQNTVAGFTVWLVSIQTKKNGGDVTVKPLELNADFSVKGKTKIEKLVDPRADFVGAVVFYDDPSERAGDYAPYALTVNGVLQPGGG
jgi:immune inhibitor InhA-like protein